MRFVKMHGIGNDYIYLDAVSDPSIETRYDLPELSRRMSDRHRGVGSDGLILVCKPKSPGAHIRMRMFNADGSESEMCGNGVRCVAKFAHDRLGVRANPMIVQTGRGDLSIVHEIANGKLCRATVDMGEPILDLAKIPVDESKVQRAERPNEYRFTEVLYDAEFVTVFVSMGNPHAVWFDPNPKAEIDSPLGPAQTGWPEQYWFVRAWEDLSRFAPLIENHEAFPNRINTHLVRLARSDMSASEARMITWERGAGATQACGTGACAVLVAGVLTNRLDRSALLRLPGGDLRIRWDEKTNHVFMTGPAEDVFEGEWSEAAAPMAGAKR